MPLLVGAIVIGLCANPPSSPSTGPTLPAASASASASAATATTTPASISPTPGTSAVATLDGQIVFEDAGQDFKYSQIWIENADGSNVRKLVSDNFTDGAPALSPDGTTVAFDRDRGAAIEELLADPSLLDGIKLVNVDGSDLREIPTGFGGLDLCADGIEGNAFSPDGRQIVFSRLCMKTGISSSLWTANIDGADAREVTRPKGSPEELLRFLREGTSFVHLEDHRASWSPDGKRLVFARIDTSTTPERSAIFTIGVDGKGLDQVTPWKLDANDPVWSPDGSDIAFNSPAESGGDQNIYTIHPDGTGLTQLTNGLSTYPDGGQATFHPSWSPDGTKILFSHNPSTDGFADFFLMNRDGTDLHVLAKTALHENHAYWGRSPGG